LDELAADPYVKEASPRVTFTALITYNGLTGNANIQGMKPSYYLYSGLKADAGVLFSDQTATEDRNNVLITEGLLSLFGIKKPEDAIGKTVTFKVLVPQGDSDQTTEVDITKQYVIKGVTSDQSSLAANMTLDEFKSHFDVPYYDQVEVRIKDNKYLQ